MTSLKESNLLVVTNKFPHARDQVSSSFVKNQLEFVKGYFEKVYVIALSPWVPKVLSNFSFMDSKGRWDGYAEDYNYDNVEVFFVKPIAFPASFSRKRRGDDAFKSADKLIRRKKLHFDIIHSHFTDYAGYAGAKLKEKYGKPLVITIHEDRDTFLSEVASRDKKLLYAWTNADRLIRVNRKDLEELEKLGISWSRLVYIPNGFSPDVFKPVDARIARKRLNLPEDAQILVNVAGLQPYKGQEYLIRSMVRVLQRHPGVMLYIVGKGPLKSALESSIEELGLQDRIILAGGDKPTEEIPLWINAGDIFVLPSLSEGNPTVMFEALGCGKPFIGTNVGGIPEIISDSRLGYLVEPKNIEGLADALIRALDTRWDNEFISGYSEEFSWANISKQLMRIYEDSIVKTHIEKL
jgi:teichuronic acid biosynthesis glycosyltransferase TuaC